MIIRSLHLSNFGKFKNKTIILDDKMNIVYGPNEAGKSTIFYFIIGMFYGFYKPYVKNRRLLELYEKYKPWTGGGYMGNLVFYDEGDQKEYRIERDFDTKSESVKIVEVQSGLDLTDTYPIHPVFRLPDIASRHLGVSYTTFINTLAVSQLGHETDDNMDKELKEALVNAASSRNLDVSVNKVQDKLTKQLDQIGTMRRKTSNFYLKKQRLDKLEKELEDAKNINDQILGIKEATKVLLESKPPFEDQIERLSDLTKRKEFLGAYELFKKADLIVRDREKVENEIEEIGLTEVFSPDEIEEAMDALKQSGYVKAQLNELIGEQKALENEIGQLKDLLVRPVGGRSNEELDTLNKHIYVYEKLEQDIYDGDEEAREANLKIDPLTSQFNTFKENEKMIERQMKSGNVMTGLGGLLVISGFLLSIISIYFLGVSGLGFVGLCIGVYLIISRRTLRNINNERLQESSGDIHALKLSVIASERKRDHGLKETQRIRELYHVGNYPELVSLKDRWLRENMDFASDEKVFVNRQEQLKKLTDKLVFTEKAILNSNEKLENLRLKSMTVRSHYQTESIEDLKEIKGKVQALIQMKRDLKSLDIRLKELLDGKDFSELKLQVEENVSIFSSEPLREEELALINGEREIRQQLHEIEKKVTANNSEIDALSRGHRPIAEIEEDIEGETKTLEDMSHRKEVLERVSETIDAITDELRHNFAPMLNQKVTEMVTQVTDEKYQDIKINPDMVMRLVDPASGTTIDATKLSRGTMDLFYIALRDALADHVSHKNKLPLVLDETFAHFDGNRLKAALKLFGKRQGQVILFTCQDREIQLAGEEVNVIHLSS